MIFTAKHLVFPVAAASLVLAAFAGGASKTAWAQLNPNAKVYRPGADPLNPPFGAQVDTVLLTDYPLKDTSAFQIPNAPALPAKIYYVAPFEATTVSGGPYKADDTKTNSPTTPWTVGKAIGSASAGSTIVFRGGTYRDVSRFFNVKLTLMAYPGEKPLLKGSIIIPASQWEARTITQTGGQTVQVWAKTGWIYDFHPAKDYHLDENVGIVNGATNTAPEAGYLDMVFSNGQPLAQVIDETTQVAGSNPPAYAVQAGQGTTGLDQMGSGRFYVDAANDTLYIGDDPTGKTLEATKYKSSLSFYVDVNRNGPNNVTIAGLGFAHYADIGLTVGAAYTTLRDCTFYWNGTVGVSFQGNNGARDANGHLITGICHDSVLQNCFFAAHGRKGAAAGGTHNILIRNNTFTRNNVERFWSSWDAAGFKIIQTQNLRCEYNLFDHNYATGFWMDISCTNANVIANEAHDNGLGIFFEISDGCILAYNLCYQNSVGIMLSNSTNAKVYNNTLSRNSTNLIVKNYDRLIDDVAGNPFYPSANILVRNNLLSDSRSGTTQLLDCTSSPSMTVQKSAGPPPVYDYYTQDSSVMFAPAGIDYNGYYRKSVSLPTNVVKWVLNSSTPTGDGATKTYSSLTAFKAIRPQFEAHGFAIDAQNPNPFFLDEAVNDYRLFAGSVAIGKGEDWPADVLAAYQTATGYTSPPQGSDSNRNGQMFPHMGAFGIASDVFVMDNNALSGITRTAGWQKSTIRTDKYGADYMTDGNTGKGTRSWTFAPNLPAPGQYRVYLWWPANATQAASVPVIVSHDGGQAPVTINEQANGGQWNLVGTFGFTPGAGGGVTIGNGGTTGTVVVDAVRFVRVP